MSFNEMTFDETSIDKTAFVEMSLDVLDPMSQVDNSHNKQD
jgi:hypothetical protein